MRHLRKEKHLGRNPSHRKALRRNLVCSFLLRGRIQTTKVKAQQTRQFAEKLITIAKVPTAVNFRRLLAMTDDKRVVRRLLREIGPVYKERAGGYTRILKLGTDMNRLGDNAPQVILEFVEKVGPEKPAEEAAEKKGEKASKAEKSRKTETAWKPRKSKQTAKAR